MSLRSLFESSITAGATVLYGLSALCLLAPFFPLVFLTEMIVSFTPHILVLGFLGSLLLALHKPRAALAGAILVLAAGWPVIGFSKYETASGAACPPGACLTVITVNLRQSEDALNALLEVTEELDLDLIAINEPPIGYESADYAAAFPNLTSQLYINRQSTPRSVGMPIALLSRGSFADQTIHFPARFSTRAFLQADFEGDWDGLRIVSLHAMVPTTPGGTIARNGLIRLAGETASTSESFIMLGDFNLTPWSSVFRNLPGRRAGDPRGVATWPVALGPFGIPIDHIVFSDDLELVDVELLADIGSDHRPILAKFKRRDSS
ncbi:MAG: endonuclease/exonuclease/phosphatase family protein [Pseudomonadota bacterium]